MCETKMIESRACYIYTIYYTYIYIWYPYIIYLYIDAKHNHLTYLPQKPYVLSSNRTGFDQ